MTKKDFVMGCDNTAVGLMAEVCKFFDREEIPYALIGVAGTEDDTCVLHGCQNISP